MSFQVVEVKGDRGAGDREKRGREVYGRREKKGREAGEREKLRNIAKNFAMEKKNAKRRKPTNIGWEPGLKGAGSGWFQPPAPTAPPPPPHHHHHHHHHHHVAGFNVRYLFCNLSTAIRCKRFS